jgi:deoxyribodipyrimidine photolyase
MAAGSGPHPPVAMHSLTSGIFNPVSQSEKFDTQGAFIRKYVPEVAVLSDRDIHAPG